MRRLILVLLVALLGSPAVWARKGKLKLDGIVTAIQAPGFTLQDKTRGPVFVLVQRSTDFKAHRSLESMVRGERAKVEGIQLDDGRVLAGRVELNNAPRPRPSPLSISLTNLGNAVRVPQGFNVQGHTAPRCRILVSVRPQPGAPAVEYRSQSGPNGHFDIPVQSPPVRSGGRFDVQVDVTDPQGNRGAPVVVQLIRL